MTLQIAGNGKCLEALAKTFRAESAHGAQPLDELASEAGSEVELGGCDGGLTVGCGGVQRRQTRDPRGLKVWGNGTVGSAVARACFDVNDLCPHGLGWAGLGFDELELMVL